MAKFTGHTITSDSALGGSIINGSLKFDDDDSPYLSRTPSSAGNRKTFTFSAWVKRNSFGRGVLLGVATALGSQESGIEFDGTIIRCYQYTGSFSFRIRTNAKYRDSGAWMHIVFALDTTQASSGNRAKLYVNGEQQTDLNANEQPSQNLDCDFLNTTTEHRIGQLAGSHKFDGYMTEVHFVDGLQLDPTYFGYTEGQTGLWRPKKYTYGNYGTNGFYLTLDSSTPIGKDMSGNGNDFSNNNAAVDLVTDSPSGVAVQRQPEANPTGSVVFDGDSDHLTITDNGDLNFGSNDWTIECFLYARNLGGSTDGDSYERHYPIIQKGNSASNNLYDWRLYYGDHTSSGDVGYIYFDSSAASCNFTNTHAIKRNQWRHIALVRDGSTLRMFLNGVQVSTNSISSAIDNDYTEIKIGFNDLGAAGDTYHNGFISNLRVVNGTAVYKTNFAAPTKPLTNITNTKLLCCQSKTSATAAAVTPASITAGGTAAASDTSPFNVSPPSNYCTFNELTDNVASGTDLSNGNLTITNTADYWSSIQGTLGADTGKFYYEVVCGPSGDQTRWGAGWSPKENNPRSDGPSKFNDGYYAYSQNPLTHYVTTNLIGAPGTNNESINGSPAFTPDDVLQIAIDFDAGKIWYGINNTYVNNSSGNAGNPATGANALVTFTANTLMFPKFLSNRTDLTVNFGQEAFRHLPPSGFLPVSTNTINKSPFIRPQKHFDVILYTGQNTSSLYNVTGLEFSPDLVIGKTRTTSMDNIFIDTVRGNDKQINCPDNSAEVTRGSAAYRFLKDGFAVATAGNMNNPQNYTAACWKAGGPAVTNTDGTISAQVSANVEAGFSIIKYTASASGGGTVGHGLSKKPEIQWTKNLNKSQDWAVQFTSKSPVNSGSNDNFYMFLNTNAARGDTSEYFTATTNKSPEGSGSNGDSIIIYTWHSVPGYSKIGMFMGNNSSSGPFVYCGFRPAWVIWKRSNGTENWVIVNNKTSPINPVDLFLRMDETSTESSGAATCDFVSNGFTLRNSDTKSNANGDYYLFMAFAEQPLSTPYGSQANAR